MLMMTYNLSEMSALKSKRSSTSLQPWLASLHLSEPYTKKNKYYNVDTRVKVDPEQ